MSRVGVWAPAARTVVVEGNGRWLPLAAGAAGWWAAEVPWLVHGADYAFRIDGEGPFPDPRSPWQPQGVHGPSRRVDHGRFPWSDGGWRAPPLAAGVIEEIHVGTFTPGGTFAATLERLDHLLELGVTHLELMPVAEFPGSRGWGYDGAALYAPHHAYGGPEGLKTLVDACHRRGLAVLLDVVYNHLGPDGNYLARFGPYFTDAYTTPWGAAVNLDQAHSDEVRRFFIDNALMWLRDYHFDGLRLDAVHAIVDTSALHFLEALARAVDRLALRLGRPLVLIAENDRNDPRLVRSPEAGGYGLDAVWNEDFHHALHALLTGERNGYYQDFGPLQALARALRRGLVYDGRYSAYRQRRHGRPAAGLPGRRFVGCLQNHDQVGNRPLGERSSRLLSPGRLKIGAALVLSAPFVPLLFQGEEWGAATPFLYFTEHGDPALGEAVRDGRRKELAAFGWDVAAMPDPQAPETFERSRLDWSEPGREPHAGILAWHRALIRLRRSHPDLADDRLDRVQVELNAAAGWLLVVRGALAILCNLQIDEQRIESPALAGKRVLLASTPVIAPEAGGIRLPGESVVILEPERDRSVTG